MSVGKMFFLQHVKKRFIYYGAYCVPCSDEENVETASIDAEPVAKFFGDGENDMAMSCIKTEGGRLDGKLLCVFDTACVTESGMAESWSNVLISTVGTFKRIVTKIKGTAQKGTFNIIKNRRTSLTGRIKIHKKLMMIKHDTLDRVSNIEIDEITV